MKYLEDGFIYYQSKLDLRKNGSLTESEYEFIDEVKRSCAFYFLQNTKRFVITASYANSDKTPPEYYISDLHTRNRNQIANLEIAKNKLQRYADNLDCYYVETVFANTAKISITGNAAKKSLQTKELLRG